MEAQKIENLLEILKNKNSLIKVMLANVDLSIIKDSLENPQSLVEKSKIIDRSKKLNMLNLPLTYKGKKYDMYFVVDELSQEEQNYVPFMYVEVSSNPKSVDKQITYYFNENQDVQINEYADLYENNILRFTTSQGYKLTEEDLQIFYGNNLGSNC